MGEIMNKKLLVTFTIGVFLLGMMELIISGILELMSDDLGISVAVTGQLITVYAVSFEIFGTVLVKFYVKFTTKTLNLFYLDVFMLLRIHFGLSISFCYLLVKP